MVFSPPRSRRRRRPRIPPVSRTRTNVQPHPFVITPGFHPIGIDDSAPHDVGNDNFKITIIEHGEHAGAPGFHISTGLCHGHIFKLPCRAVIATFRDCHVELFSQLPRSTFANTSSGRGRVFKVQCGRPRPQQRPLRGRLYAVSSQL